MIASIHPDLQTWNELNIALATVMLFVALIGFWAAITSGKTAIAAAIFVFIGGDFAVWASVQLATVDPRLHAADVSAVTNKQYLIAGLGFVAGVFAAIASLIGLGSRRGRWVAGGLALAVGLIAVGVTVAANNLPAYNTIVLDAAGGLALACGLGAIPPRGSYASILAKFNPRLVPIAFAGGVLAFIGLSISLTIQYTVVG